MIGLIFVALLAVFIGGRLPTGFLPQEDQGYLYASIQLPDASSLQRTDAASRRVTDALMKTPGIQSVVGVDGFSLLTLTESTNTGFFFVTLKPWDERKSRSEQIEAIQASMQQKLAGVSEGLAFEFPPPTIPGLGTAGGVTMMLQDRSGRDDPTFLTNSVHTFLGAVAKRPEIAVAISSYLPSVPQIYAEVDRERAAQEQVDLGSIYTTMQTFMGGYLVNYFNRFGRQWQTYVEAEGDTRANIRNIDQFYVRSANGGQVPLGSLTQVKQINGPEFIQRFNEYNGAQVNVTGGPGYSSGQVRAALEQVFRESMPPGMGFAYQGMSFQEQRAAEGVPAWMVFGLSLLIVFLILAALYESWTLPFSVLLSTPVAILGAYLALTLRSFENDIFATIGLIMLIGLSAKNAILIVQFAVANYGKGLSISESAVEAARLRFRPIIMTALAFIFGCLPLWTATGSGAVSRRILGTVVIGGMTLASILGILVVPVTFAVVEYLSHRFEAGGNNFAMDSPQVTHGDPEVQGGTA
jgi:HAE1 family hydrophobic/amphiphilic exporter-1